jgi:hypothetical protein
MKTPIIASASEAIPRHGIGLDCFVACAPRNDGECNHDGDGGDCGGGADGGGECDGSGGKGGIAHGGSRQPPALRPAIIQ